MRARLNWAWRVFATGASFLLFGIGGLLLMLFALPTLRLLVRAPDARKRRTQQLIRPLFQRLSASCAAPACWIITSSALNI